MRHALILILILPGQISIAQLKLDTTISKKALDSLYQELARYKDAKNQSYFNHIVSESTIRVDSIFSTDKDTLTIFYYSRANNLLRRQEIHLDKSGCRLWLNDAYFDTTGLKLYEEQWKMGCNWENNITGFLKNRYRYHYDSIGNETGMTMESYDGAGHRVQRFHYTIGMDKKKVWGNRIKLKENAFWD